MLRLCCTKKLLARLDASPKLGDGLTSTTFLGNWYANILDRRSPQLVLFVNEWTRLPVVVRAMPVKTLMVRFVIATGDLLRAIGVDAHDVERELREMALMLPARTSNRSVLGTMNEYDFVMDSYDDLTLPELSIRLSDFLSLALRDTPQAVALDLFRSRSDKQKP